MGRKAFWIWFVPIGGLIDRDIDWEFKFNGHIRYFTIY